MTNETSKDIEKLESDLWYCRQMRKGDLVLLEAPQVLNAWKLQRFFLISCIP